MGLAPQNFLCYHINCFASDLKFFLFLSSFYIISKGYYCTVKCFNNFLLRRLRESGLLRVTHDSL